MTAPIDFMPKKNSDVQENITAFVSFVRNKFEPLLRSNNFDDSIWSMAGLIGLVQHGKFIYYTRHGVDLRKFSLLYKLKQGLPVVLPSDVLMREPFLSFSKALLVYLHAFEKTTSIYTRVTALRYLEAALHEITGSTCPSATTPEVMNKACGLVAESVGKKHAYSIGKQLEIFYRYMVELGLVAVPSDWVCPLKNADSGRNRVGEQFDEERRKKLPSPLALEALATIFNSDRNDPKEVFASSVCALMLCSPDRAVEILFAPLDILAPDWKDPDTGEVGAVLRWFPAKGAAPMTKTVIPSMREVAIRAIDRLRQLGAPARALARWYEKNPDRIFLPPHLEYLRERQLINQNEVHAILFGGKLGNITHAERIRTTYWLDSKFVKRESKTGAGGYTTVNFLDLEKTVLAELPKGFPIMNPKTGMHYSEALCLARVGELNSYVKSPLQCCFDGINYRHLYSALKSSGSKSIFERRGYRDENGEFLILTSHMLRHYLNTLVRDSRKLSEEDIALWSGRKNVRQNSIYNHQSDRDVIAKLREAIGDSTKSVGPFANIDDRIFIRRDEFSSIKIITAHTTEFGHCVHDYAQSPCQVHQDCMHCNEQVCIKGDIRAEENLRKTRVELAQLQDEARAAFSEDVLGAAEWFMYQTKSLERVDQLIAILDDPEVPLGAVVQLSGVSPPSRLAMAEETRNLHIKPVSQTISTLNDVHALLKIERHQAEGNDETK